MGDKTTSFDAEVLKWLKWSTYLLAAHVGMPVLTAVPEVARVAAALAGGA